MSLVIRKFGSQNFTHETAGFEPYSSSDMVFVFDGNFLKIRSENGRIIFSRDGFRYNTVTVYDVGGSAETFTSVTALQQRLIDLGHPAYDQGGGIVPGDYVSRIIAGTNVTVDPVGGTGTVTVNSTGSGGGIPDAPANGNLYGRKDNAWEQVPSAGVPDGGTTGQVLAKQSNADGDADWQDIPNGTLEQALMFAASGIEDDLEVGLVSDDDFEIPFDINSLTIPSARVTDAPIDADIVIDLLANGLSILSTPITIENGSNSSLNAATQPALNISSLSKGDVITRNITQVGSTNAGKNLKITLAYEAQANVSGGGGELEYQAEITTSTTLTTQKGLNKVYPVNSASDVVITVPQGVYSENDVINFERRGSGTVEFVGANDNVRLRGVRDVENRYFINDEFSWVSLICRGGNEFSIVGRLKGGYTGAVTTSSYTVLTDAVSPQNVTVTGTGFSSNMLVNLTGNATLNSVTVNDQFECVLNITPSGSDGDLITVEYDNGNVFTDTNAITITQGVSYDTADLRVYYRLTSDANDYQSNSINGVDSNVTFGSSGGVFNGSSSQIDIPDNDVLSFGNGTTDNDLSFSFTISPNDITSDRVILMKRGNSSSGSGGSGGIVQNEYQIDLSGGDLRILFFSQDSTSNLIFRTYTGLSTSNTYHCVITKTATTIKLYIDSVEVALTNSDSGTYVAMNNNTRNLFIGAKSYTPFDIVFDGNIKRVGLWDVVLNQTNVDDLYAVEITDNQNAL